MPARVDASPRTTTVPDADRRRNRVAGMAVDDDRSITHAFARTPTGAAADDDGRAIVQAGDIVAHAAIDRQANSRRQRHPQVMAGGRT